ATCAARPTSVWINTYARTDIRPPLARGAQCLIVRPSTTPGRRARASRPSARVQAGLQLDELLAQRFGELGAERLEMLLEPRQLIAPLVRVDRERRGNVGLRHVEAAEVEVAHPWHHSDRRLGRARVVGDAAEDP